MLQVPIEGVQDEAEGDFCSTQYLEPSLRTARSTAVRHNLGMLMPSRNQIHADPAAERTHDCLFGRRKRVTVRAGLPIPRRLQQEQPCWLFGSGWFLDLPYRVVTIRQVLDTGDAHRAHQYVCPAGSPGTAGGLRWRALLWRSCAVVYSVWHCMMHHAVLCCCTIRMQQPPPSLFTLPPQPRKPRL